MTRRPPNRYSPGAKRGRRTRQATPEEAARFMRTGTP